MFPHPSTSSLPSLPKLFSLSLPPSPLPLRHQLRASSTTTKFRSTVVIEDEEGEPEYHSFWSPEAESARLYFVGGTRAWEVPGEEVGFLILSAGTSTSPSLSTSTPPSKTTSTSTPPTHQQQPTEPHPLTLIPSLSSQWEFERLFKEGRGWSLNHAGREKERGELEEGARRRLALVLGQMRWTGR